MSSPKCNPGIIFYVAAKTHAGHRQLLAPVSAETPRRGQHECALCLLGGLGECVHRRSSESVSGMPGQRRDTISLS